MYRQCIDRCSRRDSHILLHLQRQSPEKLQKFQPGLRGGTKLTTSREEGQNLPHRGRSLPSPHIPQARRICTPEVLLVVLHQCSNLEDTPLLLSDAHIIEPDMIDDLRCSFDKMSPLQGWRRAHRREIPRQSFHRSSCEKTGCTTKYISKSVFRIGLT